jgi:transposase
MKQKYSEEFVEQAVVKLLTRGKRTVREVALDLNVNYHTAKNWMQRGSPDKATASPTK